MKYCAAPGRTQRSMAADSVGAIRGCGGWMCGMGRRFPGTRGHLPLHTAFFFRGSQKFCVPSSIPHFVWDCPKQIIDRFPIPHVHPVPKFSTSVTARTVRSFPFTCVDRRIPVLPSAVYIEFNCRTGMYSYWVGRKPS